MATEGKIDLSNNGDSIVVPSSLLKKKVNPFIKKLYDMVDDSTTDRVICWGPMNNSFVVKDPEEFERDILPKCFKHNKITSFIRQLNFYVRHFFFYILYISFDCSLFERFCVCVCEYIYLMFNLFDRGK